MKSVAETQREILIHRTQIQNRIVQLVREIKLRNKAFLTDEIFLFAILKGAILFASDLLKRLDPNGTQLYFLHMSSYHGEKTPSPDLQTTALPHPRLKDKHVLIVDDILDTGRSLATARTYFRGEHPASVATCVLLAKEGYKTSLEPNPDFVGFTIPRKFVVGYGLDYQEQLRGLGDVWIWE